MRPATILLTLIAAAMPASAGPEQALSAVSAAFEAAAHAPALTLFPAFKRTATLDDEDSLIALLSDRDPSVRQAAAKSLRDYALRSWKSENALLDRAKDLNELESVRRQAIKSLAWAAQHWGTRDSLLAIARDARETSTLREITVKSLYIVAGANDDYVLHFLFDELSPDEPFLLRAAAAWALAATPSNPQTKDKLRELAENGEESTALRVEAVKSLYAAMPDWNIRDAALRLAQDANAPKAVRETAMLALNAVNQDWGVKDYLQRESQEETDPALRTAAIKALAPGPDLDMVRYFHLSWYRGQFIDPLEDQ